MAPEEIMRLGDCGMPKLWVTYSALDLRSRHPEWFGADAAYTPLIASGGRAENLVGLLRGGHVAAIVLRWPLKVDSNWGATSIELPPGRWRNTLTGDLIDGGRQRAQGLLRRFSVALLIKESDQ